MPEKIIVHVKMDQKTYRRFACFDTFRLRKAWRSPVLFCALMIGFSLICFFSQKDQGSLLGTVLAIVGLGLPIVWFSSFFVSLRRQALQLDLKKPRPAYTVTIGDALRVENDMKREPAQELAWEKVYGVWRGKQAIYLYATASKAFILPDGQADADAETLWKCLSDKLGQIKMHG